MHLTPQDILKHLGFYVPTEGVFINPHDAFLVTEMLRLAGATIDIDRIPDADLGALDCGLVNIVNSWSEAGSIAPLDLSSREPSAESLRKLRATLHVILSMTFGRK